MFLECNDWLFTYTLILFQIIDNIIDKLYFKNTELDVEIPADILEKSKSEIRTILIDNTFNTQEIKEVLKKQFNDESKIEFFISAVEQRKNNLVIGTVLQHNSQLGETIIDVEWALKLVFGTSELKSLNYPILQLVLHTVESNNLCKTKTYDMKKDVLGKIIELLESVA